MAVDTGLADAETRYAVPWKDDTKATHIHLTFHHHYRDGDFDKKWVESYRIPRSADLARFWALFLRDKGGVGENATTTDWLEFLRLIGHLPRSAASYPHGGTLLKWQNIRLKETDYTLVAKREFGPSLVGTKSS
jgi:hypothetical protein